MLKPLTYSTKSMLSTHRRRFQQGISLITAIFLLVVVASLMAYTLNISGNQRGISILNLKSARALQAARSGIDWGAAHVLDSTSSLDCAGVNSSSAFNINTGANMTFTVTVRCTNTTHKEGSSPAFNVYTLTSSASNGTFGGIDYTARSITATLSEPPP